MSSCQTADTSRISGCTRWWPGAAARIVVVDAGCDPDYAFEDLGNAIRRVRIDLGVPIDFPNGLAMTPKGAAHGNLHAAVGCIHYSALEPGLPPGDCCI